MTALNLHSRKLRQIDNFHNVDEPFHGEKQQAKSYESLYPHATHRPTPPCYTYNCHGLTFAARRTAITSAAEVREILKEDDYQLIANIKDVLPGDIVVYISQDNDIEHSGIVVEVPKANFGEVLVTNPLILSKWGSAHEVIHRVKDCPYAESRAEYYRVMK